MNLEQENIKLRGASPEEIVARILNQAERPLITTNFGPYSAALLHLVSTQCPDIEVVWIDTGYNTPQTYKFAHELTKQLQLNLFTYIPQQTAAYRDVLMGIPSTEDPNHAVFTEEVKLKPFRKALKIHNPDVWFSNLRKGQTAFRDTIDILSLSKEGILKVSPFYSYSDEDLEVYMKRYGLPNEKRYFDPTKQQANRECGLHV